MLQEMLLGTKGMNCILRAKHASRDWAQMHEELYEVKQVTMQQQVVVPWE